MISLEKECCKYRPEYRKPVTSSKFIQGPYHSGYEVVANADFLCSLNKHYRQNMKGGHRHNHIYNVCSKHALRSKQARKNIYRETKKELIRGFYLSLQINHNFGEFLHKIFHKNNNSTAQ